MYTDQNINCGANEMEVANISDLRVINRLVIGNVFILDCAVDLCNFAYESCATTKRVGLSIAHYGQEIAMVWRLALYIKKQRDEAQDLLVQTVAHIRENLERTSQSLATFRLSNEELQKVIAERDNTLRLLAETEAGTLANVGRLTTKLDHVSQILAKMKLLASPTELEEAREILLRIPFLSDLDSV